jgi:molybdenum cofactor cytidylyltransferase
VTRGADSPPFLCHQRAMTLSILILAAGSSSRMRGTDKLLERIDGAPQIARITRAALATGCATFVALPPDRPLRAQAVAGLPVTQIPIPDADEGMGASLRTAAGRIPDGPLMILLADLADLTPADLQTMITAHKAAPGALLRGAAQDGAPGHPAIIPADLRPALRSLAGDAGARDLFRAHPDRLRLVPLPANHATTDLDTPEDWAAWRASRQG